MPKGYPFGTVFVGINVGGIMLFDEENGRGDIDFIENIQSKTKRILLKKLDKSL